MSTNYPETLDAYPRPVGGNLSETPPGSGLPLSRHFDNAYDAIEALESFVGVGVSPDTESLSYKVAHLSSPTNLDYTYTGLPGNTSLVQGAAAFDLAASSMCITAHGIDTHYVSLSLVMDLRIGAGTVVDSQSDDISINLPAILTSVGLGVYTPQTKGPWGIWTGTIPSGFTVGHIATDGKLLFNDGTHVQDILASGNVISVNITTILIGA